MSELSAHANKKEFAQSRRLTTEQLDSILGNGAVQKRFERYTTRGRSGGEGPMGESEALEEAMMDVYVGARSRGLRLYRSYATDVHVKRMKRIMSDTHKGMVVDLFVPDMVDLRSVLRSTSDMGLLSNYLTAEQGGRNETGSSREEAIRAIVARIHSVQTNAEAVKSHDGPSEAELKEVTSKS